MKDGYVEGLQVGIDLFSSDLERHVLALDEVQRNNGDVILQTRLRAGLRAYANVVGGLKLKLEEAAGRDWRDRFIRHEQHNHALEIVDGIETRLADSKDMLEMRRHTTELEDAERYADALIVRFATE